MTPSSSLLTIAQFLAMYPYYSEKTVRRRVKDGSLRSIQLGGSGKRILIVLNDSDAAVVAAKLTEPPGCQTKAQNPFRTERVDGPDRKLRGPKPRWRKSVRRTS